MDRHTDRSLILWFALLVIVLACGSFLYLTFFSFPSTETIAQKYLDAIIHKDIGAVLRLAIPDDNLCQSNLMYIALRDIAKFGGAEVRGISVTVTGPEGSDEDIQWASIEFQYRETSQTEWENGKMVISTDHSAPGLRYTCGIG